MSDNFTSPIKEKMNQSKAQDISPQVNHWRRIVGRRLKLWHPKQVSSRTKRQVRMNHKL